MVRYFCIPIGSQQIYDPARMRSRALVLIATIGACAPARPERLERPQPISHEEAPRKIDPPVVESASLRSWSPAPSIAVVSLMPDLLEETHWPLAFSAHPELEPRFPIAGELAVSGIGWFELCTRGVQNRRDPGKADLIAYLAAWCAVAKIDEQGAIMRLAPLLHSNVRGLPEAVQLDLASILVDLGDADTALHELVKNRAERVETLDLLAASYQHLGKDADASMINDHAIEIDDHPNNSVRCHRMARKVMLAKSHSDKDWLMRGFNGRTDPTCVRIASDLACSIGFEGSPACVEYLKQQGIDTVQRDLYAAYHQWPTSPADATTWLRIALLAVGALPTPGADALALTALENALRAQPCSEAMDRIIFSAREIAGASRDRTLDDRVLRLTSMTPQKCAAELAAPSTK